MDESQYDEVEEIDVPKKIVKQPMPQQPQQQMPVPGFEPRLPLPTRPQPKPLPTAPQGYFPESPKKQMDKYKTLAIIFGVIIFLILAFWFISSFSKKDFGTTANVNIPENPINVNNTYDIIDNGNTTVIVDFGDFANDVAKIVSDMVMDKLNLTNSTS